MFWRYRKGLMIKRAASDEQEEELEVGSRRSEVGGRKSEVRSQRS